MLRDRKGRDYQTGTDEALFAVNITYGIPLTLDISKALVVLIPSRNIISNFRLSLADEFHWTTQYLFGL